MYLPAGHGELGLRTHHHTPCNLVLGEKRLCWGRDGRFLGSDVGLVARTWKTIQGLSRGVGGGECGVFVVG